MAISKNVILLAFLVTSFSIRASDRCREHFDIKVYNNNLEHEYRYEDNEPILVKKEKVRRPFFRHWSNIAARLHEIYYEYSSKEFFVDNVSIKYKHKNKTIYDKNFKVVSLPSGLLTIDQYQFNDGVVDKKYRPGKQTYVFKNGEKVICEIDMMHFFATEF